MKDVYESLRDNGSLLSGFQDDSVAGHEGRAGHRRRERSREIPRGNTGDDTSWFVS